MLEGMPGLALECFSTSDGHARILLVLSEIPWPTLAACLIALLLCVCAARVAYQRHQARDDAVESHTVMARSTPMGVGLGRKGHHRTPSRTHLLGEDDDGEDDL